MEIKCVICKLTKLKCFFNKNKCKKNGINNICKDCSKNKSKLYYKNNKEKHLLEIKKRKENYKKTLHLFIIDYLKTHPCVMCNESDIVVLEFDHLTNKKENVSELIKNLCKLQ